jgi:DNA repair protein RadC
MVLHRNHPPGLSEPSAANELITHRLKEGLALIDVRVLDHLIVAESIYSFAEAGLLSNLWRPRSHGRGSEVSVS